MVAPNVAPALGFNQEDLHSLLDRHDPHTLRPVGNSDHIVHIPGRDDLYLRWSDRVGEDFFVSDPADLQRHIDTFQQRIDQLRERGVTTPRFRSFPFQLGSTVIYTVVERLDGCKPITDRSDPDLLEWLGNALLDHHEHDVPEDEPRIWDASKLKQYAERDGRVFMLDLDHFLSRDPRIVYPRLLPWTYALSRRDSTKADLHRRALAAKQAAYTTYATTRSCRARLWEPRD